MVQVLEMYSSGGDLHLELPSGGVEAGTDLWQIPPYHTKQVMRANFLARAENNHTAYIRSVGNKIRESVVHCILFVGSKPTRQGLSFCIYHWRWRCPPSRGSTARRR